MTRTEALQLITAERERQTLDNQLVTYDNTNTINDYVAYIVSYVGRAAETRRNGREGCDYVDMLVKTGALVLAALEVLNESK